METEIITKNKKASGKKITSEKLDEIFNDFEARGNLVALFELAYKVDRRVNPQLYDHD